MLGVALAGSGPWLGPWLRNDPLGPGTFIAAFIALGVLGISTTLIPSAFAGFIFGPWWGMAIASGLFMFAGVINYESARLIARQRVLAVLDAHPRLRAMRDVLVGEPEMQVTSPSEPRCPIRGSFTRTTLLVALIRFIPNSPFAFNNVMMSSVGVPRGCFLIGSMLGMLPRVALMVFVGASVSKLSSDQLDSAVPFWVKLLGISVTLISFAGLWWIGKWAFDRATRRLEAARLARKAA
jgi:uncharacterized membrane protein YdjX (TVP38/TMEM64 family)